MKNLLYKIISILLGALLINSCKSKTESKLTDTIVRDTTAIIPDVKTRGIPIDFDHTKVISVVYVTNRSGIDVMQEPDSNSIKLERHEYGDRLEVIEVKDGWMGIRERITRKYKKNESTRWEKVYVQTKYTGELTSIKLRSDDLNIIESEEDKRDDNTDNKLNRLTKYLDLKLIDESEYNSQKLTSVNYLIEDTLNFKKKNGVIELPYGDKIKRYVDVSTEEENNQAFEYVGNIPFLNKYVLSGVYWESSDYKLIDKATGNEDLSLANYPCISADKKYMISLNSNAYDITGDLELYSINSTKIQPIISVSFKNWMPVDNGFWSSDGYFYVAVLHSKAFWKDDGKLNDKNYQYLKIKIL